MLSNMESDMSSEQDARAHLRAYEVASRTAEQQAHVPAPLWFWPAMGFIGPLFAAIDRLEGLNRIAVAAALLVPITIAASIQYRREFSNPARPKAPNRGGRIFKWRFAAMFCFIFGAQLGYLLEWSSGIAVAVFSYLVIAIGATFFWYKADQSMIAKTTAPVLQ